MTLPERSTTIGISFLVLVVVLIFGMEATLLPEQKGTPRDDLDVLQVVDLAEAESSSGNETINSYDPPMFTSLRYTSIEQKLNQRIVNATVKTGLTEAELNSAHNKGFNAFYDQQGSLEFAAELYDQLSAHLGAEEADFQFAIINSADDWEEVKRLAKDRETTLGDPSRYDALLLETGINSGRISADEVEMLVAGGNAALPADMVFRMASNGNIETLEGLANRGLLINPNYEHPTLSMNAIGAFIRYASSSPDQYDSKGVQKRLSVLIGLGVAIQSTSQSLDPLDFALERINESNASVKYAMVETLIQSGASVELSHLQILRRMPGGATKSRLEKLLANNL